MIFLVTPYSHVFNSLMFLLIYIFVLVNYMQISSHTYFTILTFCVFIYIFIFNFSYFIIFCIQHSIFFNLNCIYSIYIYIYIYTGVYIYIYIPSARLSRPLMRARPV